MIVKVVFLVLLASIKVQSDTHEREYFLFQDTYKSFREARLECRSRGLKLPMPKDTTEFEELKTFLRGRYSEPYWLGIKRERGGKFEYPDGERITYANWGPDQPDNFQENQGCVFVGASSSNEGLWYDVSCAAFYPFVCQFFNVLDPTGPPLYQAVSDEFTYVQAVRYCREIGGDIAMPKSLDENREILETYHQKLGPSKQYWIGVQRTWVNWRWNDGELQTFKFGVWADGDNENNRGGENCAYYSPQYDAWRDDFCNRTFNSFVCQNLYGLCADIKPRACFRKVRRLSTDEKREYCKKQWPTTHCQRTCGTCLK